MLYSLFYVVNIWGLKQLIFTDDPENPRHVLRGYYGGSLRITTGFQRKHKLSSSKISP